MSNFKLVVEFDGTPFFGWQYQPEHRTVEGELLRAASRLQSDRTEPTGCDPVADALADARDALASRMVRVCGCSRTDAGVSARNYVANVVLDTGLEPEQICRALNYYLPAEIFVKRIEPVGPDFHARFSARSKTYVYRLVRGRSPLRHGCAWELRYPVDLDRMRLALDLFRGRYDFRTFCQTRASSGICTISRVDLTESGDEVLVTIQGDRFLYKLVRRIVGAAVDCAVGRLSIADIKAALEGRDHQPWRTAPAAGLVLDSVEY